MDLKELRRIMSLPQVHDAIAEIKNDPRIHGATSETSFFEFPDSPERGVTLITANFHCDSIEGGLTFLTLTRRVDDYTIQLTARTD